MPIDPSIPLQAKGVQLESPANRLAMYGEAMKLGEMNRSIDTQNKLRDLYSQGIDVGTPEGFKQVAALDPATALKLRADALQGRKLEGDIKKTGVEIDQKTFDLVKQKMSDLAFNPSDNNIKAHLEDGILRKEVTPQQAQATWQAVSALPLDKRTAYFTDLGMKAAERAQMQTTRRGQDISASTAIRGQDISATTARRGQDLTYSAATQPIFNEAVGGFVTRPTVDNPSGTVIPLANPEATTKGQAVVKGKNLVNDVATDMATSYGVLKDLRGIKSKENSPQQNISAALQSSMAGQIGGSLMGTPEQDARDAIMSQRPILVQAIVKATGMSATQINSNVELKNLLDAATDPSKGYETNIKTLNKINKRFGLGGDIVELPTAPAKEKISVGAPQKTNPTIDALLKKYE
jgi:hypothetical protein